MINTTYFKIELQSLNEEKVNQLKREYLIKKGSKERNFKRLNKKKVNKT